MAVGSAVDLKKELIGRLLGLADDGLGSSSIGNLDIHPSEGVADCRLFPVANDAIKVLICGTYGAQHVSLGPPNPAGCNRRQLK